MGSGEFRIDAADAFVVDVDSPRRPGSEPTRAHVGRTQLLISDLLGISY
jgi:hypothetical protein